MKLDLRGPVIFIALVGEDGDDPGAGGLQELDVAGADVGRHVGAGEVGNEGEGQGLGQHAHDGAQVRGATP